MGKTPVSVVRMLEETPGSGTGRFISEPLNSGSGMAIVGEECVEVNTEEMSE